MTRSITQPNPAAPLMTHPHWCKQGDECAVADGLINHLGPVTAWSAQADDVEFELHLIRYDEVEPSGHQDKSSVRARLTVRNLGAMHLDGSPFLAMVDMDLEDLDLLMTFLTRHRTQITDPAALIEVPTTRDVLAELKAAHE
jgi:hypothetical protein